MADSKGNKLILAVAAGAPQSPIYDVVGSGKLGELRTIIKDGLVPRLAQLKTVQPGKYDFVLDYVQAPGSARLDEKIREARSHYPSPQGYDVVFTIASSATAAAQAVFGSSAGSTPIVFVVVSDPEGEGFVSDLNKPRGNTTGLSTNLRADAVAALNQFLDWAHTINGTVFVMHQPFFPPAHPIIPKLKHAAQNHQPNSANLDRKFVETPQEVINCVSTIAGGNTNGLFLMPDDLVLSQAFGGNLLSLANGKGLPAFCQQIELVDRNPANWQDNALGGMGIPGVEIGRAGAIYVDKLLRGRQVKDLKVVIPPDPDFPGLKPVCKWNPAVAENLGLPPRVPPCVLPPKYRKAGTAGKGKTRPKTARVRGIRRTTGKAKRR